MRGTHVGMGVARVRRVRGHWPGTERRLMTYTWKTLGCAFALTLGLVTVGCGEVEELVDCADICESYDDCLDGRVDRSDCIDRCEESGSGIDACDACLDSEDNSCLDCSIECSDQLLASD